MSSTCSAKSSHGQFQQTKLFTRHGSRPTPHSRRVPRLRDHELDTPDDPDEASSPAWKYTADESANTSRAMRPSSIAASHEGFTSLSLASVEAFGSLNKPRQKKGPINGGAAGAPRFDSAASIRQKSANGVAYPGSALPDPHSAKPIATQAKPTAAVIASTSPPPKIFTAPPKPAGSAFRPPTFISSGTTPNAASTATGAKRRLGMGHLVGGSFSAPKVRKVDKEVKPGGGT